MRIASFPPGASTEAQLRITRAVAVEEARRASEQRREVARVVAVHLLPPVRRMDPDEVELRRVARIVGRSPASKPVWMSLLDARDAEFPADVRAGPAAGHRVEHALRPEIPEQVLDELPGAVAGIARVAVRASLRLVVEAREPRDGARVLRRPRQHRDSGECECTHKEEGEGNKAASAAEAQLATARPHCAASRRTPEGISLHASTAVYAAQPPR